RLISWQCKKQTIVATSTTEAEYVAAANCCRQVLWIQNQMLDYGFNFMNTKIYIDNESTICIVKNPVYHSKTKHIAIRHHFIRDAYEKKDTLSSCSDSEIQQMQLIQDKTKESCMVSFQRLHSHLKCLLNNDLKGSRTEDGFKRAFTTLFCQDLETFTGTMFLNVDQLEKQLDNKEFQEIGSMASFKVLETQFQMFINSQIYLNDEYIVMTRNYFLEYTRLDIPEFRDTLIQNMDYVKKSIEKRALHKMEYDSRVNERLTQTTEEKVDSSKALCRILVI
ncbi:hypothetical protein Tco_0851836, partial [Tanacetum coccineum]